MATVFPAMVAHACAASPDAVTPRGQLLYFENMRAITALLVIATHCLGLGWSGSPDTPFAADPLLSMVTGATPVFVFVSGFFFHHAALGEFRYAALLLGTEHALGLTEMRYPGLRDPIAQYGMAVLAGGGGPAMWYIPFAFDLLLLSPLFLLFARAGTATQRIVLIALLALGLLVDRSAFDRLANLGHFAFYYALGIQCSIYRTTFEALVRRPETILAAAGAMALLGIAHQGFALAEAAGTAMPWPPGKFVYLHKLALIVLMAGMTLRFADRRITGLTQLARRSFGLFLVHQLAILLLMPIAAHNPFPAGHGGWLVYSALTVAITVALLWAARRILGERARLLVGA